MVISVSPTETQSTSRHWPRRVALALLVLVALSTRLPAPWRIELINDEMHHLESWRNRYGTNDVYPLFLERLQASGKLSPQRFEQVRKIYQSSTLVQRGLIVLVDPQPPIYPLLAEITQMVSDSSLLLLRTWSVVFGLLSVYVAFLAGRELRDDATGVCLATLICIGSVAQFFSGIGRPYALTQLVILVAFYAFARRQHGRISLPAFLGCCLLAQSVQWMAWSVVLPLVFVEVIRSRMHGTTWRQLLVHGAWYGILSALLLVYMFVQLRNPTISNQGGPQPLSFVWWCFAVAEPFAHLGSFGDTALNIGCAIIVLLAAVGVVKLLAGRFDSMVAGVLLAVVGGLVGAVVIGVSVRFVISYITPTVVLAAIGLRTIGRGELAYLASAALLLVFGFLSIFHPENPYDRIDPYDAPWSKVGEAVRRELKPGDTLVVYPPNTANCIYRFVNIPEPVMPISEEQLRQIVKEHVDAGRTLVLGDIGSQEIVASMGKVLARINNRAVLVEAQSK